MPSSLADFLHPGHGVVEVAFDLHGQGTVIERLRELAVGDLPRADEDDRLHQPRGRAVEGQRGAGVAGRGAGGPAGADEPGVAEGRRHAVVLETARGVHPLVLQVQAVGPDADVAGGRFARLQEGLPFADGDAIAQGGEGQQFVESPDAAKTVRIVAMGPFFLKRGERFGNRQPRPVVGDVEEVAATTASHADLVDGIGFPAMGGNTALEGGVRGNVGSPWDLATPSKDTTERRTVKAGGGGLTGCAARFRMKSLGCPKRGSTGASRC